MKRDSAPTSRLSIMAMIAAFNEADIIEQVIVDLIQQDVQIYFLDDSSTDGTAEIVARYVNRGVLAIERLPASRDGAFEWAKILRRKEQLVQELDADWFIHADADEFRESPWPDTSLRAAIGQVDALGYNAIDFELFDFRPDHDDLPAGGDVREAFRYYAPTSPFNRLQIRCWKKTTSPVDLIASGGHEARFNGRDVFPIRFLLRHYPIRGRTHGVRKVLTERLGRYVEEERARQWHVHYLGMGIETSFIWDRASLLRFDEKTARRSLPIRVDKPCQCAQVEQQLRAQLDAQRREQQRLLAQKQQLIDTLNAAATMTLHQSDRLRAEVEWLTSQVDEISSAVAAIRQSRSWRWTAPARAVLRGVRGY